MKKKTALIVMAVLIAASMGRALAHTRDQVRQAYRAVSGWEDASPYADAPSIRSPYAAGSLRPESIRDALNWLNFARWLAGLDPVSESEIYNYRCQRGAVLLASLDYVDHGAPKPADMDQNFYDSAHIATTSGSIAKFNWMRDSILRDGVAYFLRDDGEVNLPTLGHRRWALNPLMAETGFGLANSEAGNSYVVMYAHDLGNADAQWDRVCWPAPGAFPATLMHEHLAWSIVLNPERYDLAASTPRVTLSEEGGALRFQFDLVSGVGDGFCAVNLEGYGAGPCLIFRPDFSGTGFTDYQQNQRWRVRVNGLVAADGSGADLDYVVEMISLRTVDAVNVEISPLEAELRPGETLMLSADVVPAYADDLSVTWRSTDEGVCTVDGTGVVTAVAPGRCEIIVRCSGGAEDACVVAVCPPD